MSGSLQATHNSGRAMMVVGLLGVLAGFVWLMVLADPFPMWLIMTGGGLVFIGTGAALNRTGQ